MTNVKEIRQQGQMEPTESVAGGQTPGDALPEDIRELLDFLDSNESSPPCEDLQNLPKPRRVPLNR